ncbi:unnamed protein product [Durusdinium trenchii]|uniref:Uncharacterized protein n=1 Tax=Durusdinium trenchii TaxID=1381693 RepID=A0ABP0JZR5_9DINO
MANEASGGAPTRLERFDGSDPSLYKRWRRRAALMIIGLPNTYPAEKHGPKLIEFLAGEAELAVEHIPVEDLAKSGGEKLVFKALDDRFKPLEKDDMNEALKEFFFETSIRSGETMKAFITRFMTVERKLQEQGVALPEEVQGWFMLRKLHLDANQEAMLLTATRGSFKVKEVSQAVRAILANAKGSTRTSQKDTFMSVDDSVQEVDTSWDEDQEVLQVLAAEIQENDTYDEEELLDTFETYKQVRTKMQEVRKVHIVESEWPEQEDYDKLLDQTASEIELGLDAFMIQGSGESANTPRSVMLDPWNLLSSLQLGHLMPMEQHLDQQHDLEDDSPRHPQIAGDTVMMEGKFKTKPHAPANTFRYIYTCQKNYTGWVRSHIGGTSSQHLRTFKAYVEMRDTKKAQRLERVTQRHGRDVTFHSSGIVAGSRPSGGISAEYTVQQMVVPPLPKRPSRMRESDAMSNHTAHSWQMVTGPPGSTYGVPMPKRMNQESRTPPDQVRRRRQRDDDMEIETAKAEELQYTWTMWTMELMNKNEEAREHVEKEATWMQNTPGGPQKVARILSRLAVSQTTPHQDENKEKEERKKAMTLLLFGIEMRQEARKAFIDADNEDRIRRAVERRTRPERGPFYPGCKVYVWRPGKKKDDGSMPWFWRGPGTVIGASGSDKVWVSFGTKVLKCSPEQLRRLRSEDEATIRLIPQELIDWSHVTSKRGVATYHDISADGRPPSEEAESGRDYWELNGILLRRIHVQPRQHLYIPLAADEPPVELDLINSRRKTMINYQNLIAVKKEQFDDWREVGAGEKQDPWTGCTVFTIKRRREEHEQPELSTERYADPGPQPMQIEEEAATDTPNSISYTPTEAPEVEPMTSVEEVDNNVPSPALVEQPAHVNDSATASAYGPVRETPLTRAMRQDLSRLDTGRRPQRPGTEALQAELQIGQWTDRSRHWKISWDDGVLIRLHGHQRGPYRPCEKTCPVPLQWLTGRRYSLIRTDEGDGYKVITDDNYLKPQQHHPELHQWTGYSVFEITTPELETTFPTDEHEVYETTVWEGLKDDTEVILEESKRTEVEKLFKYKAMKIIPPAEAQQIRRNKGRILPSRFVITEKPDDKQPGKFKKKIHRNSDGFVIEQREYAEKLNTIKITRERKRDKEQPLNEKEKSQLRGVAGGLNWLSTATRPDLAAMTAKIQQNIQNGTVENIGEANRAVAEARDFKHVAVKVVPIDLQELTILVTADASWATESDLKSQSAYMVCATTKAMHGGKITPVTPLKWKSQKQDRAVSSTLAAELYTVSKGVAEAIWTKQFFLEVLNSEYNLDNIEQLAKQVDVIAVTDNKYCFYDETSSNIKFTFAG